MRRCVLAVLFVLAAATGSDDARAQFCPGVSPWVFDDVLASDPFCGFITKMAQQGVTLGCIVIDANHRLYCPNDSVSRKQMAAFMARLGDALLPPTCATGQVMKWNGSAWGCAADNAGGGSSGTVTSVMAGAGLTGSPNPITGSGTLAVDTAYVQRRVSSSCAAGSSIRAIAADGTPTCQADSSGPANAFVQGGNAFGSTASLGTTDAYAVQIRANDKVVVRYVPNTNSPNVIAGHEHNSTYIGVQGATIAGGGVGASIAPGGTNMVVDSYGAVGGGFGNVAGSNDAVLNNDGYATIGGGLGNRAEGEASTIGGGANNLATEFSAIVGGGMNNRANGFISAVAGGRDNVTWGDYAAVAGGRYNVAQGHYSFVGGGQDNEADGAWSVALGRRAKAPFNGNFVFADSNDFDFSPNGSNNFRVRATGGVRFVVDIDGNGNTVWSCGLVAGGSWVCSSDARQKQNFERLDGVAVLDKLAAMPVYAWNPKGANAHVRHYGPTAQDFHAAFGLGDTDLGIGQQDADGVALAAIQGLNAKFERAIAARDAQIASQARELAELRGMIESLVARTLEPRVVATGRPALFHPGK